MRDLLSRVEETIQRHRLCRAGEKILVATSGGLDSMVLLTVLDALAARHRWRLVVAHFNHGLRGRASHADEALVRQVARRMGWPCVAGHGEVRRLAREHGVSVEMAARHMRHVFLARTARRRGIRTVTLGHHADDRVESFFLRLLRGAGLEGLAGMKRSGLSPTDHRVRLVRPLFDLSKAELRAQATKTGVRFRDDASNRSLEILRNRVRHKLLPLLRRHYQPALDRVVLRLLTMLEGANEVLGAKVKAWQSSARPKPFAKLQPALRRTILLNQLHKLGVDAEYDLVEKLRVEPDDPVMVAPGRRVRSNRLGKLIVDTVPVAANARKPRQKVDLSTIPRQIQFEGLKLSWSVQPGATLPARQAGREFFDADRVGPQIVLRHWRPGDRFQPIGLPHPVKLQDWFTNRKVPRTHRHELVVATTRAGQIFWVEDQRMTESFKVTPRTRHRLRWAWKRL